MSKKNLSAFDVDSIASHLLVNRRRFLRVAAAAGTATALGAYAPLALADEKPKSSDAAEKPKRWVDDWKRADGPLGNGWRAAHDDHPNWWDPIALHEGKPVNAKPDKGKIAQPNNSGARAAAYQDFGPQFADNFTIGMTWNGRHDAVACAIACINLDDPDWGLAFCFEPQIYTGVFVLWAMGRRPDQIRVVHTGAPPKPHKEGTPMFLEMRVRGDKVECLADDRSILTHEIPKALAGSSTHGFVVDVNPIEGRPANAPVIGGPFILAPLDA